LKIIPDTAQQRIHRPYRFVIRLCLPVTQLDLQFESQWNIGFILNFKQFRNDVANVLDLVGLQFTSGDKDMGS